MRVFIWENVEHLTNREHDDGGVIIVAHDLGRAIQLWKEKADPNHPPYSLADALDELEPDIVMNVSGEEATERIFCFPDAGCC